MKIIFIILLIVCCKCNTNIFISQESDWCNPSYWSLNRIPNDSDTVIIRNKVVIIVALNDITIKNLIIEENTIFSTYNTLNIIENCIVKDSVFMLFNNVFTSVIQTNNSVIWLMNNASLSTNKNIIINLNDNYIIGESSISSIKRGLTNEGTLTITKCSTLSVPHYNQTKSGSTIIYYDSILKTGNMIAKNIDMIGQLEIKQYGDTPIKNISSCIPIFRGDMIQFNVFLVNELTVPIKMNIYKHNVTMCL
jgi:hypothetical protein